MDRRFADRSAVICNDGHPPLDPRTTAVRAGIGADEQHGAVVTPVHLSVNYTFTGFGQKRHYDYGRSGNPTRDQLAEALAGLEGGAGAVITASGMAAVLLVVSRLRPGDRFVAPHDCYGGTHRLFRTLAERGHFEVLFVDQTDEAALDEALEQRPKLVWIESPSNPLLRITDIRAVTERAHAVGALAVADNTFLSPALQRPLSLGADMVVHSTTKYINGHSDVVGGAVVAAKQVHWEELAWDANCLGLTGSPFDSYLTLRGLRTLYARVASHQANAAAIVDLLQHHAAVRQVYYPGLPSHPGHGVALRQQAGFGGMVSFDLVGGGTEVEAFLSDLRCFSLAESLGGVESLVAHPVTMTHAAMDPEARKRAGIGDSLLRLSVGIESAGDLVDDLERALDRCVARPR